MCIFRVLVGDHSVIREQFILESGNARCLSKIGPFGSHTIFVNYLEDDLLSAGYPAN